MLPKLSKIGTLKGVNCTVVSGQFERENAAETELNSYTERGSFVQ